MREDEIKYLLSRCENGTQDIISTRSNAYRSLNKNFDDMSMNELIMFIQDNPSVLKRPIILSKNSVVVGFDEEEITSLAPAEIHMRSEDRCPASCSSLEVCYNVRRLERQDELVLDL